MKKFFSVLSVGFHCIDIIETSSEKNIFLGGTAANVASIWAAIGQKSLFLCPEYGGAWGEWLKKELKNRKIELLNYTKTSLQVPRVIEKLDQVKNKHYFILKCPQCGQNLSHCILPKRAHISDNFLKLARQVDVFYCDRISEGIKYIFENRKDKWNFYEPNSCRNYNVFIENLKLANIVKVSNEKITEKCISQLQSDLKDSNVRIIIISCGEKGVKFSFRNNKDLFSDWISIPAHSVKKMVDSSGAGDWLTTIFLFHLLQVYAAPTDTLDLDNLMMFFDLAQRGAAIKCEYIGAQSVLHNYEARKKLESMLSLYASAPPPHPFEWGEGCSLCGMTE